jgi:galactose mutarotase-like enzyme
LQASQILLPFRQPGSSTRFAAGHYRATVTQLGAGLRELLFGDQPVIAGYEADELPPGGAGQLLAPRPNRIDGGRYVFGGTEYQLALTEPDPSTRTRFTARPAGRRGHPSATTTVP